MRPSPPLPALLLLALAAPLPAQEDTLVRWYDVRALEAADLFLPDGVDVRMHGTAAFLHSMEPDRYDVDLEGTPAVADLGWSDLLLEALGADWPDETVFVADRGGFLKVEGGPESQREVARLLAELEAQVLRPVELEAFVLPRSAVPAGTPGVVGPAQLDALLRDAALLDHARGTARLGRRAKLGTEAVASLLGDYDVEVAQRARTADALVMVLRTGLEVGALVRERPGGGLFLRVWGRRGRPAGEPRRVVLGGLGGAPIELPALHTALFTASAELEDGGAVALDPGRDDEGVVLVRAARPARDAAPSRFVPLGALIATPLLLEPPWLPRTPPSGGWSDGWGESYARQLHDRDLEAVLTADDVLDEVVAVADALGIGERPILVGNTLWVPRDDALLERTRAVVRELEATLVAGTLQLELRYGLRERGEARRLASLPAETLAGELEGRLLGAGRPGDALCLVAGVEAFTLVDHDVEIAEGTAIADPTLASLFDGVSLWCRPLRTRGGRVEACIELELQELLRPPTPFPVAVWEPDEPAAAGVDPEDRLPGRLVTKGTLELSATARAALRGTVELVEGRWGLVGCTPLAGTDRALVAVLRATPVPAGD